MPSETRICKNCEKSFDLEQEDLGYYEKIKVPPPTWCPECRQQRRYAWRNERVLYRRKCDLCGKSTVTIYSPNKPFKVYCPPCWWSDDWTGLDYGRDFDPSRPFFEQWQELQLQAPRIALLNKNSVNSEYTNHSGDDKDCYLCFGVFEGENNLYSTNMYGGKSRDSMDCYRIVQGGELLYECIDSERCYNCQYSMFLRDCNDCLYCFDCRGCNNCFMSWNLRKKQYCILNQQYSKEEYMKRMEEIRLSSHAERQKLYDEFLKHVREDALHRYAMVEKCVNSSGNNIVNSRNLKDSFDIDEAEDSRHLYLALQLKDCRDAYHCGISSELIYECHGLVRSYDCFFTHLCYDNSSIQYCDTCHNSQNLFGCVSLKSAEYCILNKRYSEADYHALREKIIAHMRETGEYGEYFPPQISPIGYNETQGQVYMPLKKEEVLARGWKWEEQVPGTFGKETVKPEDMPDTIEEVEDSVLKEVLACKECGKNYNIVRPELELYRRFKTPLPRLCPDCRYRRRVSLRLPRRLWHRQCMCEKGHPHHSQDRCPNEFETAYDPERSETIYCEECYNAEVV